MTDQTTNRGYPRVLGTRHFSEDVLVLRAMLDLIDADMQAAFNAIATKTGLFSPAFTGTPTAPTPASGDDSDRLATTAFVKAATSLAIANLVGASPAALDTLNELAAALGNDPSFATTVATQIGLKANSLDVYLKSEVYSKSQMDTLLASSWAFIPIGMKVPLSDNLAGVVAPPTDQAYRYIKLTAGLTGAGGYNNGVLGSESVSGSAPQVQASAVVNLSSSPLNGQTVRLINTERRFLRAYDAAGTIMDDAFQGHTVKWGAGGTGDGNPLPVNTGGSSYALPWYIVGGLPQNPTYWSLIADAVNGTPRTAIETRGKFIGETYFMRIK